MIDEKIVQVQELPYEKFNRINFYKEYNIDSGPKDKFDITMNEAKDEMAKIMDIEGGTGFAYFLLEYCIVSHPTVGSIKLRDHAYKWQVQAALDFVTSRYIISLKSRQVAFSTTVGAYCLYRCLFFDSQRIAVVSKNQDEANEFLDRLKFIYEHLPDWMKQPTSEWAVKSVKFAHNNSRISSLPNRGDPAQGKSLSLLVADEFASYQDQGTVLSASTPALSAGALTPFSNTSMPSQFFVISTLPRKKVVDNEYLRLLHGAQDNPKTSRYKLIEVEVDDIPVYRNREWHLEMLETLGARGYRIEVLKQEVYETEHALLEGWAIKQIETENPIRCDFLNADDVDEEGYYRNLNVLAKMNENFDAEYKYIKGLWIFEEPIPGQQYVITVDVATKQGSDNSAFHVMKPETHTQVAEYRGKVSTEKLREILDMIIEYYNQPKLSIENTGLGISICEYYGETLNYENFYWHQKSKKKFTPGIPMSTSVRPQGIAYLENMITRNEIDAKSIRFVNELRSFGMTTRGKIAAISGHDDLVMAMCQYCYLVNIGWAVSDMMVEQDLYGIAKKLEKEEEKEKKHIPKYFEEDFDIDLLPPAQREAIMFAKATGTVLSGELIRKIKEGL